MSANLPPRKSPPEEELSAEASRLQKEQYSLDEMMKALRDKEREKEEAGEMVTRSDGSLARKVKRRRRRSEQPNKANPERARRGLMIKIVSGAVLLLLLFLTGLFLLIYQNSKGYREKLEEQTAAWTGAEVELGGLKRLPFSCQINQARFQWGESSYVRDLQVRKVTGDVGFSSFLGARPGGLRLGGVSGKMTLQTPMEAWEGISLTDEEEFPFDFDQYYCDALDVSFGDGELARIKDAAAIMSYEGAEGYQVTIDEGFFSFKGWEDFVIANALLRFKQGMVEVKSLSLEHKLQDGLTFGSQLDLTGTVKLKEGEQGKLELSTEGFPLGLLVGEKLARFIDGSVISSKGNVMFTVGQEDIDEIYVDFEGDSARMSALPFVENLPALFPERGFDALEFTSGITRAPLSGTLRVRPSGMALENLRMAKQGIRLEGDMIVASDGRIGGRFKMSLNRFFLSSHPKLKDSPLLAGSEDSGYVTVEFPVGGTLRDPKDGFLRAIAPDSGVVPTRPRQKESKKIWDQLLQPGDSDEELDLLPEELRELERLQGD